MTLDDAKKLIDDNTDLISEQDLKEIYPRKAIMLLARAISSVYDAMNKIDKDEARTMIETLRIWLNDETIWDNSDKNISELS